MSDVSREPITLVVLGASGDMARRLLFPALYVLDADQKLGDLKVVGYALEQWSTDEFKNRLKAGVQDLAHVQTDATTWQRFAGRLSYRQGDLSPESLNGLKETLAGGNIAFYLALPPGMFASAASAIASTGLNQENGGWRRLVIEKPFGIDLASAEKLNQELHENWTENQIFRIDHFLGKETVQNILVFRFSNRFLDPVLNSSHVAQVQITAAETLGLEGRYRYYDRIGALRDMLQSHLMQVLTLVAMEPPSVWDSDVLREHKVEVLHSVLPIADEDVDKHAVRGQYTKGAIRGQEVPGYRDEGGVGEESRTETFAAIKLFVNNWRWSGVPFYLRSGKRMTDDLTEVAITFRDPPLRLFSGTNLMDGTNNRLVFRLRPAESINLYVQAREPGIELKSRQITLHSDYSSAGHGDSNSYLQLLLDVLEGDRTSFLRFDEVEWAWRILAPILSRWQSGEPEPYAAGTDGPAGQERLMADGQAWRSIKAAVSE